MKNLFYLNLTFIWRAIGFIRTNNSGKWEKKWKKGKVKIGKGDFKEQLVIN